MYISNEEEFGVVFARLHQQLLTVAANRTTSNLIVQIEFHCELLSPQGFRLPN